MSWLQLRIDLTGTDALGRLEARLTQLGAAAVTLTDAGDTPVLEPGPGETPLWPGVTVTALFPSDTETGLVDLALGDQAGSWSRLDDRPWEREWLKDFAPMAFGDRLWVCPHGVEAGEPGDTVVHIEPGLGFGTGTHPTTGLCLEWLAASDLAGARVIDYGCGSGILAVAALRLGAQRATAVDIDPQALTATRANALRNEVADRLEVDPDIARIHRTGAGGYDVVLANILANPLIELAPTLISLLRPNGRLVLAGLLAHQAGDVVAAYADRIVFQPPAARDGWVRLAGRRRKA